MTIEMTLKIIPPESPSSARRVILRTSGQTVLDAYEHALTRAERDIVGRMIEAHAVAIKALGESIRPTK